MITKVARTTTGLGLVAALCVVPGQAVADPVAPPAAPAVPAKVLDLVLDGRSFSLRDAFAILRGRPVSARLTPQARRSWPGHGRARWRPCPASGCTAGTRRSGR
ncbi:hypothetical protein ACFQYP_34895 [Nonomuraea antimicrobica]